MPYYQLKRKQKIPADLETVWHFISMPDNLKIITPPYMGFEVTSKTGNDEIYPGMMITYKVKPVLGIPLTWVTEITHVQTGTFFVDEQRMGPYRLWHHQHKLEPIPEGVLMTDVVTYILPLGFLGAMANALFIRKQLNAIFSYRHLAVEEMFGSFPSDL